MSIDVKDLYELLAFRPWSRVDVLARRLGSTRIFSSRKYDLHVTRSYFIQHDTHGGDDNEHLIEKIDV